MAKRHSIPGMSLLGAATLAGAPAAADEAGCTVLAERVQARVVAVVRAREPRLADVGGGSAAALVPAIGGRYTCSATAAVASRALGHAARGLDVRLQWNDDRVRPGKHCLSHRIDQCHPARPRFPPLPPSPEFELVAQAWRSVAQALASQMPYGPGGDLSSFTAASLDAALSSELAGTLAR